ncbi:GNAT family N-acetyltransferase [Rhodococcus sp. EPR-157]|nr:GNAT family N-acetyltransferase [Rhodococcus sp. EPR-157]
MLRRERPADRPAVLRMIHDAFAKDDGVPIEVGLTERLFDDGYIPELSLVALDGDRIVGYVIGSRGFVGDIEGGDTEGVGIEGVGIEGVGIGAVGIGPLAVLPEYQGRGVGTALMFALVGAAEATRERLLVLLGEPDYYGRFGFQAGSEVGVGSPDPEWGTYFQALQLSDGPVNGTFRYAKPFDDL